MNALPSHTRVLIVGAGFGGLGLAIQLRRRGDTDFVLMDRGSDVGGTWRDNTYPGAACDVPSHLYCYSFRTNPSWSRVYSPGGEILDYLREAAREEQILPHLSLDTNLEEARWDAEANVWRAKTSRGEITANFVVTATGHLADEAFPNIPGLDTFTGEKFHSARWDHSASLEGKRIGVVGTGASAIQIIPEMAKIASELVVFQRTPSYVIPRVERDYTEGEKRLFERNPEALDALRSELFWVGENSYAQRRAIPQFLEAGKQAALTHLATQVTDEKLRAVLTPSYEPGCKRVLISNTYYPALQAPITTVEPSALNRVEGSQVIAASGEVYELDALVFATGFEATEPPYAQLVFGREGKSLSEHWDQGMQAYRSVAVAGFPNLFSINGPNTSLGHNSIVYIIEAQIDYILGAMDFLGEKDIPAIEPLREEEEAYVAKIQKDAQGTVWVDGGCSSWYLDARSGKLTLIWPDFGFAFRNENSKFDPAGYGRVDSVGITHELTHA